MDANKIKKLRDKLKEYRRVLKITSKPGWDEFKSSAKITGLGIIIIGAIGFLIYALARIIRDLVGGGM